MRQSTATVVSLDEWRGSHSMAPTATTTTTVQSERSLYIEPGMSSFATALASFGSSPGFTANQFTSQTSITSGFATNLVNATSGTIGGNLFNTSSGTIDSNVLDVTRGAGFTTGSPLYFALSVPNIPMLGSPAPVPQTAGEQATQPVTEPMVPVSRVAKVASVFVGLATLFLLIGTLLSGIVFIHPILAAILLLCSPAFYIMAAMKNAK